MFYSINNNQLSIADKIENLSKYFTDIKELPSDYESGKYIVLDNKLTLNPDFQTQKQEKISKLFLTRSDVERAIYKAKGMDFDDILNFVSTNPQEGLDIKALKIELKANNFYRGNPYVSLVGSMLGFSPEQLDNFFEDGNYEHLLV